MLRPFCFIFIQLFIDTARSRVCETVERPSICLSHRLTAAAACGEFPAGRPAAGDIDRLQTPALCSNPAAAQYSEANAGSVMSTAEERKRSCFITSQDYNMIRQCAKLSQILTIHFVLSSKIRKLTARSCRKFWFLLQYVGKQCCSDKRSLQNGFAETKKELSCWREVYHHEWMNIFINTLH